MSTLQTTLPAHGHEAHAHANHDPYLAHHFDTREQQYQSAKLGMWTFLGTEILMFGGLFCAYSVYRHNHPDVFAVAHEALNRTLGAINTIVLITSSLTMAWGVRCAQLGQQKALRWLLAVTLIGGYGFLGIKAVEYHTKWEHQLWFGSSAHNTYYGWNGTDKKEGWFEEEQELAAKQREAAAKAEGEKALQPTAPANLAQQPGAAMDPNAGTPDQAKITANFADTKGLAPNYGMQQEEQRLNLSSLNVGDRQRVYTFFATYFFMTGLHGVHVVVGMILIYWVLLRAAGPRRRLWLIPAAPISVGLFLAYLGIVCNWSALIVAGVIVAVLAALWAAVRTRRAKRVETTEGEFGPHYFTPVDLVGLYWHLVDMIWIFLFPLLYLIH